MKPSLERSARRQPKPKWNQIRWQFLFVFVGIHRAGVTQDHATPWRIAARAHRPASFWHENEPNLGLTHLKLIQALSSSAFIRLTIVTTMVIYGHRQHDLDLSGSCDVIGYVTIRFGIYAICYWWSIRNEPLSLTVFEIFGPIVVIIFYGHRRL